MGTVFTSYTVKSDPRVYWTSDETQFIANMLPDHSKIRRDGNSVGQAFLNSVVGIHTEHIQKLVELDARNSFLVSASNDIPDRFFGLVVDRSFNLTAPQDTKNFVRNSSFEIRSDHSWFSDDWDWNGQGELLVLPGFRSEKSIRIRRTSNDPEIAQLIDKPLPANSSLVLSLMYKTEGVFSGQARLEVKHPDNTITNLFVPLTSSSIFTRSHAVRKSWTKPISSMTIRVLCSSGALYLDDFMLELGLSPSGWRPFIFDSYRHIQLDVPAPIAVTYPRYFQYVGVSSSERSRYLWWYSNPTSAEIFAEGPKTNDPVTEIFRIGRQTEFNKSRWPVGIKKVGNLLQRVNMTAGDIYTEYSLRFLTLDGFYTEKTYELEAITVFRDRLWCVIRTQSWDNTYSRYLAICKLEVPLQPKSSPVTYADYIEVLSMIELPVTDQVENIFFMHDNADFMYAITGSTKYTIRLRYNYFTLDSTVGKLLFRDFYGPVVLTYANDARRS